ncbi:MAG: hypothetical protein WA997_12730, partial [Anaerolineales bacterium]
IYFKTDLVNCYETIVGFGEFFNGNDFIAHFYLPIFSYSGLHANFFISEHTGTIIALFLDEAGSNIYEFTMIVNQIQIQK